MTCDWCASDNFKGMTSGTKIPLVCKDCGGGLGHIDIDEFNRILRELAFYKKKYQENTLTNSKE